MEMCKVGAGCGSDAELRETYETDKDPLQDEVCRAHSGRFCHKWPMTGQTIIERNTDATR
jgi:hypothetical protein